MIVKTVKDSRIEAWFMTDCEPLFLIEADAGPVLELCKVSTKQELLAKFCTENASDDIVKISEYLAYRSQPVFIIRHEGDSLGAAKHAAQSNDFPYASILQSELDQLDNKE